MRIIWTVPDLSLVQASCRERAVRNPAYGWKSYNWWWDCWDGNISNSRIHKGKYQKETCKTLEEGVQACGLVLSSTVWGSLVSGQAWPSAFIALTVLGRINRDIFQSTKTNRDDLQSIFSWLLRLFSSDELL